MPFTASRNGIEGSPGLSYNQSMKRALAVIIGVVLLAALVIFGLSDSAISIADTEIPDNGITTSQAEAGNRSASATIAITMYAMDD